MERLPSRSSRPPPTCGKVPGEFCIASSLVRIAAPSDCLASFCSASNRVSLYAYQRSCGARTSIVSWKEVEPCICGVGVCFGIVGGVRQHFLSHNIHGRALPRCTHRNRLAVAPVGSKIVDESGAAVTIQRTAVGGVQSEGMFCDSRMLGWIGGAENIAAQMPPSLSIGTAPPFTKPRGGAGESSTESQQQQPQMSEMDHVEPHP
jgi:hypothetical protein